jgi:arginyl-tRNA synthetase
MEIKQEIKTLLLKALDKMEINNEDMVIDHPVDISHGDYSSNVAMILAKKIGSNPKILAEDIAKNLEKSASIKSITVAGNGFINFHLSDDFFENSIKKVLEDKETFGQGKIYSGKKILIEHSSPNLFKPFHIGHVMNNTIGESISRLAEFSDAKTTKISYPSDASLGIGKAVWALLEHGTSELENLPTVADKLTFLGNCYVQGTKAYEENPGITRRVKEITEIIYKKTPSVEYNAYLLGRDLNLKYFMEITKRLGSSFDDFIYESEAGIIGKKLVLENLGSIFEESDNAVVYKGEKDGLHTRVFINAEGYPTYEAKDIGLLWMKFERYNPDISIFVTDNQQKPYFEVVISAAGKINPSWQERTIHRTHGRMSFKGQKMSSRLGGVPTASEVLDVITEEAKTKMGENATNENAEIIAIAALKFTILKSMAGKDIDFDPETSMSFEGDSGPYLQYTNARINSILEKSSDFEIKTNRQEGEYVTEIERLIYRFPEVVEDSIKEWSAHYIATYLLQLARAFNSWYGNTKILDIENKNTSYNLAIAKSVGIVLQNGLRVLGIECPKRM